MYYSFKIILYATGEILESSRFYAKRGNARRYLPRYCYGLVKLHGEAVQGMYSIEIKSEGGKTLYAMAKLQGDIYEVTQREGWKDDALPYWECTDTNPTEEDL